MKGYTNPKGYINPRGYKEPCDKCTNPKGIVDKNSIPNMPRLKKAGVLEIHMKVPHAPYGMGKMHEVGEFMSKKIIGVKERD